MSAIADDPGAELRALRERAYGPDADIHDDPVAMQRLRELEDGERARPTPAVAPDVDARRGRFDDGEGAPRRVNRAVIPEGAGHAAGVQAAYSADPPVAAEAGESAPVVQASAPTHPAPVPGTPEQDGGTDPAETTAAGDVDAGKPADSKPWWRRRMPLLWAGSVVAAALLGAAIAVSMQAIAAGQVAVLSEDADSAWPEGFFSPQPEGGAAFEDFLGLTAVRVPQQMGPEGTISDCLYVLVSPSSGMLGAGCSAGTVPATAAILVTEQAPDEVLERFEPGTALQFVLDGSQVRVYAAAPVPGATP
jgi:hypothetical protein